jgi:hypothetical protein
MSDFIFQLIRGRTRATISISTRGEEIFHHLAGGITAQIMDEGKRRDAALSRPAAGAWPDESRSTRVAQRPLAREAARGRVHLREHRDAAL